MGAEEYSGQPALDSFVLFLYAGFSLAISDRNLWRIRAVQDFSKYHLFPRRAMYVKGDRELSLLVFALGCAVCLRDASSKEHYLGGVIG